MLRLAIRQHLPPGALTPLGRDVVGSCSRSWVTITQIDGNLRRQFLRRCGEAPSFYFIDIPDADATARRLP